MRDMIAVPNARTIAMPGTAKKKMIACFVERLLRSSRARGSASKSSSVSFGRPAVCGGRSSGGSSA